ncbi:CD63 antigen [Papilio machaon]|uniref:CD63 antigen n=1 Tax=Papilio machaon TaxID=76193 RepID=A0A0N0PFI0_PAPMA|nr:CD63 antigen [Papilio machaon]
MNARPTGHATYVHFVWPVFFAIFLLVIFIAELAVGIAGYVKHDDIQNSIVRHLNTTIKDYPTNKEVQSTFDILQTDVSCS